MQQVYRIMSTSVADLGVVVEESVEYIDSAIIKTSCASTMTMFEMMMLSISRQVGSKSYLLHSEFRLLRAF